jgi:hypothetical protein
VPCASLDEAEGWEAGTGPTTIGRTTDAGMRGIDDAEGVVEDSSTCEVSLLACSDVEVADGRFADSGDRSSAVEAVCCEAKMCSTLTVESDAGGAASFLNTKGVDVRGGGSGVPFGSPRTLRFKGGSSAPADLPFLPPTLESLPAVAALVAARASCSSNMRSHSASTVQ